MNYIMNMNNKDTNKIFLVFILLIGNNNKDKNTINYYRNNLFNESIY